MSIQAIALDGEEDRVRLHFAAVDDHRGDGEIGILNDLAVRHLGELLESHGGHGCPLRLAIRDPRPAMFSPGPAALPQRRSHPFPRDCPAITVHTPTLKLTDGAGREHRFQYAKS